MTGKILRSIGKAFYAIARMLHDLEVMKNSFFLPALKYGDQDSDY